MWTVVLLFFIDLSVSAEKLLRRLDWNPSYYNPLLRRMYRYIQKGWPDHVPDVLKPYKNRQLKLTSESGCVLWGIRAIVPQKLCQAILDMLLLVHPTKPAPPKGVSKSKSKLASVKKSLKIVHLNACSILCHFDDVQCLVNSQCPNIVAVSEAWLGPSVSDAEASLPGYSIYLLDHARSGGEYCCLCCQPFISVSNILCCSLW